MCGGFAAISVTASLKRTFLGPGLAMTIWLMAGRDSRYLREEGAGVTVTQVPCCNVSRSKAFPASSILHH